MICTNLLTALLSCDALFHTTVMKLPD